jgi:hypothetical protein
MDHHLGSLKGLLVLALVVCGGCAPLFLAGKSEECRRAYDSCLNGCPQPSQNPDPYVKDLQIDVAECTNACNEKARHCN